MGPIKNQQENKGSPLHAVRDPEVPGQVRFRPQLSKATGASMHQ